MEKYKLTMFPTFTKGTRERYSGIIRDYLAPMFGDKALRELTPMAVKEYIANLKLSPKTQKSLSHESIDKVRDVLSSILDSAKAFRLLV